MPKRINKKEAEQRVLRRENRKGRLNLKVNQQIKQDLYYRAFSNVDSTIFHFPEDLWINVFSYLPTTSIIRLRFTCKLFHFLLTSPKHSHVYMDMAATIAHCRDYSVKRRKNICTRIISEQQLELYHAQLFSTVNFSNTMYSLKLKCEGNNKALSTGPHAYDYNDCWHDQTQFVIETENSCSDVERLAYARISEEALFNIINEFAEYIENLILDDCDAVTDLIVTQLIAKRCVKLKKLSLRNCCKISMAAYDAITSSLVMKNSLESFDITNCPGVKFEVLQNAESILGFKHLSTLKILHDARDFLSDFFERVSEEIKEYCNSLVDPEEKDYEYHWKQLVWKQELPVDPSKYYNYCHNLKEFEASSSPISVQCIPILTCRFPKLEKIILKDHSLVELFNLGHSHDDRFWNAAKKNTTLKQLELYWEDGSLSLDNFVQCYPGLQLFNFKGNGVEMTTTQYAEFFKNHQSLEVFICDYIKSESIFEQELPASLTTFSACMYQPDNELWQTTKSSAEKFFSKHGKQFKTLSLSMYYANTNAQFIHDLTQLIRKYCCNLEELDLSTLRFENNMRNPEDHFLIDFPTAFPKLKRLFLSGVSDPVAPAIDKILPAHTNLELIHCHRVSCSLLNVFKGRTNNLKNLYISRTGPENEKYDCSDCLDFLITPENAPQMHTISCYASNLIERFATCISHVNRISLNGIEHSQGSEDHLEIIARKSGKNMLNMFGGEYYFNYDKHNQLLAAIWSNCPNLRYLVLGLALNYKLHDATSFYRHNIRTLSICFDNLAASSYPYCPEWVSIT